MSDFNTAPDSNRTNAFHNAPLLSPQEQLEAANKKRLEDEAAALGLTPKVTAVDGDNVLIEYANGLRSNNRIASSEGGSFDAFETAKDAEYLDKLTLDSRGEERMFNREKLIKQRNALDIANNWEAGTATNEDVFAEGKRQQLALQAQLDQGAAVQSRNESDYYGRNLVDVVDKDGNSFADQYNDPKNNADYNTAENTAARRRIEASSAAKKEALDKKAGRYTDREIAESTFAAAVNNLSAFKGSGVTFGEKVINTAPTLGSIGYNNRTSKADRETYQSIKAKEMSGEPLTKEEEAFKTLTRTEEVDPDDPFAMAATFSPYRDLSVAGELDDFATAVKDRSEEIGAGKVNRSQSEEQKRDIEGAATQAGKEWDKGDYFSAGLTLLKGTGGALVDHPAASVTMALESSAEMAGYIYAAPVTMLANISDRANKGIEDFKKNHDGKYPEGAEMTTIMATSIAATAIDKVGADAVGAGLSGKFQIGDMFKKMSASDKKAVAAAAKAVNLSPSKLVTGVLAGMATEFVEEGSTNLLEQYAGTQDFSKLSAIEAYTAASQGAAAGGVTRGSIDAVTTLPQNVKKDIADIKEARAANKDTEEVVESPIKGTFISPDYTPSENLAILASPDYAESHPDETLEGRALMMGKQINSLMDEAIETMEAGDTEKGKALIAEMQKYEEVMKGFQKASESEIEAAAEKAVEEGDAKTFASSMGKLISYGSQSKALMDKLSAVEEDANASPEVKAVARRVNRFMKAEQKYILSAPNKTARKVHEEIMGTGRNDQGELGLRGHMANIQQSIASGDEAATRSNLTKLERFRDTLNAKYDTIREGQKEADRTGQPVTVPFGVGTFTIKGQSGKNFVAKREATEINVLTQGIELMQEAANSTFGTKTATGKPAADGGMELLEDAEATPTPEPKSEAPYVTPEGYSEAFANPSVKSEGIEIRDFNESDPNDAPADKGTVVQQRDRALLVENSGVSPEEARAAIEVLKNPDLTQGQLNKIDKFLAANQKPITAQEVADLVPTATITEAQRTKALQEINKKGVKPIRLLGLKKALMSKQGTGISLLEEGKENLKGFEEATVNIPDVPQGPDKPKDRDVEPEIDLVPDTPVSDQVKTAPEEDTNAVPVDEASEAQLTELNKTPERMRKRILDAAGTTNVSRNEQAAAVRLAKAQMPKEGTDAYKKYVRSLETAVERMEGNQGERIDENTEDEIDPEYADKQYSSEEIVSNYETQFNNAKLAGNLSYSKGDISDQEAADIKGRIGEKNTGFTYISKKGTSVLSRQKDAIKNLNKLPALMKKVITNARAINALTAKPKLFLTNADKRPLDRFISMETGRLPSILIQSMAVVGQEALNGVLQESRANMTPQDMEQFLGLDKGARIDPKAQKFLIDKGSLVSNVVNQLGQKALRAANVKATGKVDGLAQAKLETAVGMQILEMLNHQGLVDIMAVKSNDLAKFMPDGKVNDGESVTLFVKVTNGKRSDAERAVLRNEADNLNALLEKEDTQVFPRDKPMPDVRDNKANLGKAPFMKGTRARVSPDLVLGLNAANRIAYVPKNNLINVMNKLDPEKYKAYLGYKTETEIAAMHVADRAGALGKNTAVERGLDGFNDYMNKRAEEGKEDKPFFFEHYIIKNGRMFIKNRMVNPQNDKNHRHLIGLEKQVATIKMDNSDGTMDNFLFGLAQAFDYDLGTSTAENFRKEVYDPATGKWGDDKKAPLIKAGVEALIASKDSDTITEEQQDAIFAALNTNNEGAASFDGLVAMSEMLTAKDSFDSNLFVEIDGTSNGLISTMMQLPMTDLDKSMEFLRAGGQFFDNDEIGTSKYLESGNLDNYERTSELAASLLRNNPDNSPEMLKAFDIVLDELVITDEAKFQEDPDYRREVTSAGRKAGKTLLFVNYGSGKEKVQLSVAEAMEASIYKELMDARKAEPAERKKLVDAINLLLTAEKMEDGSGPKYWKAAPLPRLTVNTIKDFEFTPAQRKSLYRKSDVYRGVATWDAMQEMLGDSTQNMAHVNNAMRVASEVFVYRLNAEIASIEKENGGRHLTETEVQDLIQKYIERGEVPGYKHASSKGFADSFVLVREKKETVPTNKGGMVELIFDTPVRRVPINADGTRGAPIEGPEVKDDKGRKIGGGQKSMKQNVKRKVPEPDLGARAGTGSAITVDANTNGRILIQHNLHHIFDAIGSDVNSINQQTKDLNAMFDTTHEWSLIKSVEERFNHIMDIYDKMPSEDKKAIDDQLLAYEVETPDGGTVLKTRGLRKVHDVAFTSMDQYRAAFKEEAARIEANRQELMSRRIGNDQYNKPGMHSTPNGGKPKEAAESKPVAPAVTPEPVDPKKLKGVIKRLGTELVYSDAIPTEEQVDAAYVELEPYDEAKLSLRNRKILDSFLDELGKVAKEVDAAKQEIDAAASNDTSSNELPNVMQVITDLRNTLLNRRGLPTDADVENAYEVIEPYADGDYLSDWERRELERFLQELESIENAIADAKAEPVDDGDFKDASAEAMEADANSRKGAYGDTVEDGVRITHREETQGIRYNAQQRSALSKALDFIKDAKTKSMILAGYAGTGKTTLAASIVDELMNSDREFFVTAPTNAAVVRLKDKIKSGGPRPIPKDRFMSLHAILYGAPNEETGIWSNPELPEDSTLIVDEASMIGSVMLNDLLNTAREKNVKIIFMGDGFQLPPVQNKKDQNNKDPKMFENMSTYGDDKYNSQLTRVERNDNNVLNAATHIRQTQRSEVVMYDGNGIDVVEGFKAFETKVREFVKSATSMVVLASTNAKRMEWNSTIREWKYGKNPPLVNDNEPLIGVGNTNYLKNSQMLDPGKVEILKEFTGTISSKFGKPETYKFALISTNGGTGKALVVLDLAGPSLEPQRLKYLDVLGSHPELYVRDSDGYKNFNGEVAIVTYGHATTVHKSQGNEWTNVFFDTRGLFGAEKARMLYTGVTRAQQVATVLKDASLSFVAPKDLPKSGQTAFDVMYADMLKTKPRTVDALEAYVARITELSTFYSFKGDLAKRADNLKTQLQARIDKLGGGKPTPPTAPAAAPKPKAKPKQEPAQNKNAVVDAVVNEVVAEAKEDLKQFNAEVALQAAENTKGISAAKVQEMRDKVAKDGAKVVADMKVPGVGPVKLQAIRDATGFNSSGDIDTTAFEGIDGEIVTHDNAVGIFDNLVSMGNKTDSAGHTKHLRGLLSGSISNVLKKTHEVELRQRVAGMESSGSVVIDRVSGKSQVYLQNAVKSVSMMPRMSSQEVFAHELMHVVFDQGLKHRPSMYRHIKRMALQADKHLRKVAKATGGQPHDIFLNKDAKGNVVFLQDEKAERAAAQAMYDHVFNNPDYAQEFATQVMTNEALRNAVGGLKTKIQYEKPKTFLEHVLQFFEKMMDHFSRYLNKVNGQGTINEEMAALARSVAAIADKNHDAARSRREYVAKVNNKVGSLATKALIRPYANFVRRRTQKKYERNTQNRKLGIKQGRISGTLDILEAIAGLPVHAYDGRFVKGVKEVSDRMNIASDNFAYQALREMRGSTDKTAAWTMMQAWERKMNGAAIDIEVSHTQLIKEAFEDGDSMSKEDWHALTAGLLQTEMFQTAEHHTPAEIIDMLRKPKHIDKAVDKLKAEVKEKFGRNAFHYNKQAENLGMHAAQGLHGTDMSMLNGHNIANLLVLEPDDRKIVGDTKEAEQLIERIASLYAMKYTAEGTKQRVANIMEKEYTRGTDNGIAWMYNSQKVFKDKSLSTLFLNDKTAVEFGYIKGNPDQYISTEVADMSQEKHMKAKGYTLAGPIELDAHDDNKARPALFVSNLGLQKKRQSGVTNLGNRTMTGTAVVDTVDIIDDGKRIKRKQDSEQIMYDKGMASIMKDFTSNPDPLDFSKNYVVPVMGPTGVSEFRYIMHQETRNRVLKMDNQAHEVLGSMVASVTAKRDRKRMDRLIVEQAKADMDAFYKDSPKDFVRIHEGSKDPKIKELAIMLSSDMKEDIKEIWGMDGMYVQKSMVDAIFGFKKMSLTNTIAAKLDADKEGSAIIPLVNFVRHSSLVWEGFVSRAKQMVVIFIPAVVAANFTSNLFTSVFGYGMSPIQVAKYQKEGLAEIRSYTRTKVKRDKLQQRLDTDPNMSKSRRKQLDLELMRMNADLSNSPAHPLVKSGVYTTIVEDVSKDEDVLYNAVRNTHPTAKKFLDKLESVPSEKLKEVYEVLTLKRNTRIGREIYDLTTHSDFIARYSAHKFLTEEQGMGNAEALRRVMDDFVSYDINTSPVLQWANDKGLFMYTKFWLRIQGIIVKMLARNPGNMVAAELLQRATIDMPDIPDSNIIAVDPIDKLNNLAEVAGQALTTPMMNVVFNGS